MALDTGVTCWLMVSGILVMLMTPGVGLFYGGLVRKKNFISMIALSLVTLALVSIQWVLFGYSLAFGHDIGGFIGNLQYLGLNGVSADAGTVLSSAYFYDVPVVFCVSDNRNCDFCSSREDQTLIIHCVHHHMAHRCLLPSCTLGLGWWLGSTNGPHRFCRRGQSSKSVQVLRRWLWPL